MGVIVMGGGRGANAAGSPEQRARVTLAQFVFRARRIAEHSLAADRQRLEDWSHAKFDLSPGDGQWTITWDFPDEEALDSLAARCRPFLLTRDSVYHAKVMNALGFFVRDRDAELAGHISGMRALWQALDQSDPRLLGYMSQARPPGEAPGVSVTDKVLAYAWLYGDLVHADEHDVSGHRLDQRFQAGVLLVTRAAVFAIATLHLVMAVRDSGLLELDDALFTEPVVARGSRTVQVAGGILGPVGTPADVLVATMEQHYAASGSAGTARVPFDGDAVPEPLV